MLAALLLNLGDASTDPFASPGDYRLDVLRRRKRKPRELVEEALQIAPQEAGAILQPFLLDGAGQELAALVDFRKLLEDSAAFEQLQILVRRREEEEMVMILALME